MSEGKIRTASACAIMLVFGTGCDVISPDLKASIELVAFTSSNGHPAVTLRLTNTGDLDLYNASCDALAMAGNTIVDSAFLYFADGATIKPGQSAVDTGTWFSLSSTSQFQTATWQCSYLER